MAKELGSWAMGEGATPQFDEGQFARTVLRVHIEGEWWEIVPGAGFRGPANQWPLRTTLYVISGRNPGYTATDEDNERWHGELEHQLRTKGWDPMPAVGSSPDGNWVEPSWAVVGIGRDEACAVGRIFGQVAVFEIDRPPDGGLGGGVLEIRVISCSDGRVMSTDR